MNDLLEEKRVRYQKSDGVIDCYFDFYLQCGRILIEKIPNDFDFVHKGDELYRMFFSSNFYGKILYATDDGFFVNFSEKFPKKVNKKYHLYSIYKTLDILQHSIFYSTLKLGEDEFTKESVIKATLYGGNKYGFSFGMILIRIEFANGKHRLNVDYSSKRLKFKKNHVLHFLLDDGRVLTFSNFTKPIKCANNSDREGNINMSTSAIMTNQDINMLATHNVVKWNLLNEEGSILAEEDFPSIINMSDTLKEVHRMALQDYLKKYLALYNRIIDEKDGGASACISNDVMNNDNKMSSSTCFVYLMLDTTNNYYKIGISNNPMYRERTLQSEKPTIELLCAKEYPSRSIAEAFESSLHRVFSSKRIRGEWFSLSASDVEDIKQSLK